MDNSTSLNLSSREATLAQRLSHMQQALSHHQHHLQIGVSQQTRFEAVLALVDDCLSDAEGKLQEDLDKSMDEGTLRENLDQLKIVSLEFNKNQAQLDSANEMGYRMPLSERDSARLRQANQKWRGLGTKASSRYHVLQGQLLAKQDFSQKCEAWMNFLAQAERDLTEDIAGNYNDLLQQQQMYEVSWKWSAVFEAKMETYKIFIVG